MANTYSQIHLHFVMAVKHRNGLIKKSWKEQLYKYITGIVQNNEHKMLCINGMPDHVHLLIGFRPVESISHFMQYVKANSSKWINENKLVAGKFEWQSGFGVFSYGKSQLDYITRYIINQEKHHRKKTFKEEYVELLQKFQVDFDEKYIFTDLEDQ
jgi:putative transposase